MNPKLTDLVQDTVALMRLADDGCPHPDEEECGCNLGSQGHDGCIGSASPNQPVLSGVDHA